MREFFDKQTVQDEGGMMKKFSMKKLVRAVYPRDLPEWKVKRIARLIDQQLNAYEGESGYSKERLEEAIRTREEIDRIIASESESDFESET